MFAKVFPEAVIPPRSSHDVSATKTLKFRIIDLIMAYDQEKNLLRWEQPGLLPFKRKNGDQIREEFSRTIEGKFV